MDEITITLSRDQAYALKRVAQALDKLMRSDMAIAMKVADIRSLEEMSGAAQAIAESL